MSDLKLPITDLADKAIEAGVGITVWIEEDFVWVADLTRSPKAPAGAGRDWLQKLIALSHQHAMPVRLCCTYWNDPLVSYYTQLGFIHLYTEGEEAFLECVPPQVAKTSG